MDIKTVLVGPVPAPVRLAELLGLALSRSERSVDRSSERSVCTDMQREMRQ